MPLNCWEVKKCGREPGGARADELGICRAATQTKCNGANRGANGGRVCWLVSGTLCGGEVQGQFAQKLASCSDCDFYKQVHEEEGPACQSESEVLLSLGDPAEIVHSYEELRAVHARLKEAQAELLHVRKLEAVGQLAAGIAHEISTPTQFIGNNLTFLKEAFGPLLSGSLASSQILNAAKAAVEVLPQIDDSCDAEQLSLLIEEIPRAIDQSLEGIRRVTSIVQALKEFAPSGHNGKVLTDIHRAIDNTITIASGEWRQLAEVRTIFDSSMPRVPCIADEFNQVILNLLMNASQAIRSVRDSRKAGIIIIETRRDGDSAEIRITDNGPGIPQAIQHRIFEPFFTTKEVGKGTGQGLYLAYLCVAKKHGGTLGFECLPGQGTTFIVRLPIRELPPDQESGAASPASQEKSD
jgi:signal transduction histidine kinase